MNRDKNKTAVESEDRVITARIRVAMRSASESPAVYR